MAIETRNKTSVEFSMASMTDIVFLLLIFFIIISTMVSPSALRVKLPTSNAKTTGKQTVSVSIDANYDYYVGGELTSETYLEVTLQKKLAGEKTAGIILHADENIPMEKAMLVMEIANRNKYELVLATKPE